MAINGVGTPPTASERQGGRVDQPLEEASVGQASPIGVDIAKPAFQAHGADACRRSSRRPRRRRTPRRDVSPRLPRRSPPWCGRQSRRTPARRPCAPGAASASADRPIRGRDRRTRISRSRPGRRARCGVPPVIVTGRPCHGRSANVRSYRLCTRAEVRSQRGQAAELSRGSASTLTWSGSGMTSRTTRSLGMSARMTNPVQVAASSSVIDPPPKYKPSLHQKCGRAG